MTQPAAAAPVMGTAEYWPVYRPVPFTATSAGVLLFGGAIILGGIAVIESTGAAAAACDLLDGADPTGLLIAPLAVSAGQSTDRLMPDPGVTCLGGLFLNVLSGTVRGSAWVCDLPPGAV